MSKQTVSSLSRVLFGWGIVSGLLLLLSAVGVFLSAHIPKLVLFLICNGSGFFAFRLRIALVPDEQKRQKRIKAVLFLYFVIYLLILLDFTLADDSLGRTLFQRDQRDYSEFFHPNINLIPFATIRLFLRAYRQSTLSVGSVVENLLGNWIAFMPLAFYLPCLVPNERRRGRFFVTVLCFSVGIEILQFLLMTGSPDVDDVLLNVLGAMFLFDILQNRTVTKWLAKLTFGVWQSIENKE